MLKGRRSLWMAGLALAAVAVWAQASAAQTFAGGDKADSRAVKPCQDEIRNKVKEKHADAKVNFESVETHAVSAEVVGVKGKFNLLLGAAGNTMNYKCRVDVKEMKVKRAEWGNENK